jgi:hypothetical protein
MAWAALFDLNRLIEYEKLDSVIYRNAAELSLP